jgi:hypothetical protein
LAILGPFVLPSVISGFLLSSEFLETVEMRRNGGRINVIGRVSFQASETGGAGTRQFVMDTTQQYECVMSEGGRLTINHGIQLPIRSVSKNSAFHVEGAHRLCLVNVTRILMRHRRADCKGCSLKEDEAHPPGGGIEVGYAVIFCKNKQQDNDTGRCQTKSSRVNVDRRGKFQDDMDETKAVVERRANRSRLYIRTGLVASVSVFLEIRLRKKTLSTGDTVRHKDCWLDTTKEAHQTVPFVGAHKKGLWLK